MSAPSSHILNYIHTYRRRLNIDGSLAIQYVVEQIAVLVVTLDFGIDRRAILQRLCCCLQLCLQILWSATKRRSPVQAIVLTVLISYLLAVVVRQSLLFDIRVIVEWPFRHVLLVCGRLSDRHGGDKILDSGEIFVANDPPEVAVVVV